MVLLSGDQGEASWQLGQAISWTDSSDKLKVGEKVTIKGTCKGLVGEKDPELLIEKCEVTSPKLVGQKI